MEQALNTTTENGTGTPVWQWKSDRRQGTDRRQLKLGDRRQGAPDHRKVKLERRQGVFDRRQPRTMRFDAARKAAILNRINQTVNKLSESVKQYKA